MAESRMICRAGKDDLKMLLDLCDLLEQAREMIKRYPQAGINVTADVQQREIAFSIDIPDEGLKATVERDFPHLNIAESLKFHC